MLCKFNFMEINIGISMLFSGHTHTHGSSLQVEVTNTSGPHCQQCGLKSTERGEEKSAVCEA